MPPPRHRPKSLILLNPETADNLYSPATQAEIGERTELLGPAIDLRTLGSNLDLLRDAEVFFTGWGCRPIDATLLAAAPRLRAIFFAGGTIKSWITPEVWARDLIVCSAYGANAVPVAEYTLATLLFSLKRGWHYVARQQREQVFPTPLVECPGAFDATVGIISLGAIGRLVCERLRAFDVKVLAFDPFTSAVEAEPLGVSLVSLEELFSRCDVVSLHAPHLPATEGLITGALLERMRPGSTFINTARGAIVREAELLEVFRRRPDLTAVLDVLVHETSELPNSLLTLPNVIVTPHIAGALGRERLRLGRLMVDEFKRWQNGEPLRWQITSARSALLA